MRLDFNCKANNGITSTRCVVARALFIPNVFFELVPLGMVGDSGMNTLPRVVCYSLPSSE